MTVLRVLVVEDEPLTLASISSALRIHGIDVVAESRTAANAIIASSQREIDAAVVDFNLGPGPNGIDLAFRLRENLPMLGIVLLTSFEDPRFLTGKQQKMPRGVQWVVKRDISSIDELIEKIRISLAFADQENSKFAHVGLPKLSSVQIETLIMLAAGYSNAEIAKRRFVTERSVEQTINRLAKAFKSERAEGHNQRASLIKSYFSVINAR